MLIAGGFLFFGAMTLWYGFTLHRQRRKVLSWPQAAGTVVHREVAPSSRAGKTSVSAFRYEALVQYRYEVGGASYTGDKLYTLGWATASYKNRKRFLDKIPDSVPVYYDPKNPAEACLLPHEWWSVLLGYLLGGIIFLFGLGLLLASIFP